VAAGAAPVNRTGPSAAHGTRVPWRHLRPSWLARATSLAVALVLPAAGALAAADTLRISGTGSGTGGMTLVAQAYTRAHPGSSVEVLPALGSAGGIRALIGGRLAIAVANRPPNAREAAQVALAAVHYARTPFVLALHRQLGIEGLTSVQLADIYEGKVATFPNGKRARPMLRRSDATDMGLLKALGPSMEPAVEASRKRPGVLDAVTDTEAADVLESTPGAIGPSTLALIESEKRQLVALAIDGRAPTLANLASGQYPHQKQLYLITHQNPPAPVQRFIDFVRSDQGRRILSAAGHAAP
jgi:phosphate transport system substrate-binding protein